MSGAADPLSPKPALAAGRVTPVTVDNQAITVTDTGHAVTEVIARARRRRGFTLFTLNLDHLVKRRRDAQFREAYDRAALVTADGMPVVALARRTGAAVERTTGSDLIASLCAVAA